MTEPSDLELEVLKAFWRGGAMSAREAQGLIEPELGWSASTTRTVLERMVAKGLLTRRSVHGLAVYEARTGKVDVIGGVLNRLRGLLEIDGRLPASAFAGSQILSDSEIQELEALLNKAKPSSGQETS
ncbi:BlaI/MecI/CopY family transcriptional regulator [Caulobacter sp.]|uniref:BlaI/MecI/CopY family transcriptional regulator n=1 Tax=Caulobacter sp. TaxID=78 RepID=UPI002B47A4EB|nr:BlaI/MecI/CopY family transcriptional regulator [Caulobacter sp.]HJV43128.1 BlaI/MecI/CopY family transcriptional regulator [Caulobacter sp.]